MSKGARLALLLHGELLDEDHAAWNLLERHQKPLFSRQAFAFISLVGPDGLVRPVNFFSSTGPHTRTSNRTRARSHLRPPTLGESPPAG